MSVKKQFLFQQRDAIVESESVFSKYSFLSWEQSAKQTKHQDQRRVNTFLIDVDFRHG